MVKTGTHYYDNNSIKKIFKNFIKKKKKLVNILTFK